MCPVRAGELLGRAHCWLLFNYSATAAATTECHSFVRSPARLGSETSHPTRFVAISFDLDAFRERSLSMQTKYSGVVTRAMRAEMMQHHGDVTTSQGLPGNDGCMMMHLSTLHVEYISDA